MALVGEEPTWEEQMCSRKDFVSPGLRPRPSLRVSVPSVVTTMHQCE